MTEIIDSHEEYVKRLLSTPKYGEENILAWYEHRLGAIFTTPRMLLMPIDDHLAHRGDGVFETIQYEEGKLHTLDDHLSRMERSASAVYLTPPCPWEKVKELVKEVAAAGKEKDGLIRVLLGRGPGGFGVAPSECPVASLYIIAYRFTPHTDEWYAKGLTGSRTSIPAKQSYLARVKNTNYLPNALMMHDAASKNTDIPFCFDPDGYLTESSVANLCIVNQEGVIEVPEFHTALTGTTIMRALSLVEGKIPYRRSNITEEDILNAKEVLLMGTSAACVGVVSYNGKAIGDGKPGPVSKLIREALYKDSMATGTPF